VGVITPSSGLYFFILRDNLAPKADALSFTTCLVFVYHFMVSGIQIDLGLSDKRRTWIGSPYNIKIILDVWIWPRSQFGEKLLEILIEMLDKIFPSFLPFFFSFLPPSLPFFPTLKKTQ
jgi:hypothetical protein